jgi:hypothetical protein
MIKSTKTLDQLRQELSGLNLFGTDALMQIESALHLVNNAIDSIEIEIDQKGFATVEDEIYFFRNIRPELYALQIAYSELRKIELLRHFYNKKNFKNIIKQKLQFVQDHYIDYPEFTRYFNSKTTQDDKRYFIRSSGSTIDCIPLFSNSKNSTGYDVLASYILAHQLLVDHFNKKDQRIQNVSASSKVNWNMRKVDFVELVSGIYAMSSQNNSEIDLKTLCSVLGPVFNVEIRNVYGKRNEIKERKGERFKYIRQMLDILERDFDEKIR